jgi:nitrilase
MFIGLVSSGPKVRRCLEQWHYDASPETALATFIAAAVQWAPSVHDAEAGAQRASQAIAQAAKSGARGVVFPEVWLQGYPYWAGIGVQEPEFQAFRERYFRSGVAVPGPEIDVVQQAAARHQCTVVLGVTEREHGTLYCTMVYIGPDGKLLGRQRKLMPTLTERLVWGMGDGSDIAAYDTEAGRIGGLMCFEHHMALARYAVGSLGVQVHASLWPGYGWLHPVVDACTRQLSFENGCFVVVAREVMSPERVVAGMPAVDKSASSFHQHGGSAIIAPGGEYLAGPVYDQEAIITAEIDLERIGLQKWFFDGSGHYSRPDVLQLRWHRHSKRPVEMTDDGQQDE